MNHKSCAMSMLVGLSIGLSGCVQSEIKTLDKKVKAESEITDSKQLQSEATKIIDQSSLTPEKKDQLKSLQSRTGQKLDSLLEDSLKLRELLVKDVVAKQYNRAEVHLIQKKMKAVEDQRMAVILGTIDEANRIIGRETDREQAERLLNEALSIHERY